MPKFSIIIPAHNAANHIRVALDSIKNQDLYKSDYELIVVCDACTDDTESIAKEYGAITENVNFNNDGLTRNRGIELATGEWLLFMDDDDHWLHEYVLYTLEEQVGRNNEDILCFAFIWKHRGITLPLGNEGRLFPSVWNKCWRREFVVKNNLKFPPIYSVSDLYFHTDAMKCNPKVMAIETLLYYYNYMREGSISEITRNNKDIEIYNQLDEKATKFAAIENDYGI